MHREDQDRVSHQRTATPEIARVDREKHWRDENREAFASINAFIDSHGLASSRQRHRPYDG